MPDSAPRDARPSDVPEILTLIRELAEYEKAAHEVRATEDHLHRALFGDRPAAYSHVIDAPDGAPGLAGFSIWFVNYSTWLGVHGIYLEDLFVRPVYRKRGYGKAFMQAIARECVTRGYGRFEWAVLDWNEPALEFYRSLGALPMSEWTVHRLTGDALRRLSE
jgi:GNAT superfamily N-acetyltransferase